MPILVQHWGYNPQFLSIFGPSKFGGLFPYEQMQNGRNGCFLGRTGMNFQIIVEDVVKLLGVYTPIPPPPLSAPLGPGAMTGEGVFIFLV